MANEITVTIADAALPEVTEKEALRALYASKKVANPDVVLFKTTGKHYGDTVDFTELGGLTVGGISAAGALPSNTAWTHTRRQIALNIWQGTNISVPRIVDYQSAFDYQTEFGIASGKALGVNMDDQLLDDHGSITTNVEGATAGASAGAMTDALVRAAVLDLDALDVPEEDRTFIFHPTAKWQLLADPDFKNADRTGLGKGAMVTGQLPTPYGVKWVQTSRVVTSSGVLKNLLLQKSCIGMVLQQNVTVEIHDKVGDATTRYIGWYLMGEAVLRENHGVVINTAA